MMTFGQTEWRCDPYRFGVAQQVFDENTYHVLVDSWPDESMFASLMSSGYCKLSLSEKFNRSKYEQFISSTPAWKDFHSYIKSEEFILAMCNVADLPADKYTSRFEFSSMPAKGGKIDPHTDIPSKVATLVVPMRCRDCSWDASWGGGTDILKPLDPTAKLEDYKSPLNCFAKIATVGYKANQALVFIKSRDSWHSAGPFSGPGNGPYRRTLTINIEKA